MNDHTVGDLKIANLTEQSLSLSNLENNQTKQGVHLIDDDEKTLESFPNAANLMFYGWGIPQHPAAAAAVIGITGASIGLICKYDNTRTNINPAFIKTDPIKPNQCECAQVEPPPTPDPNPLPPRPNVNSTIPPTGSINANIYKKFE